MDRNNTTLFEDIEQEENAFEEDNAVYLSKSQLLRNHELKLKQTIQRNKIEKRDPNTFLPFLGKIANALDLHLAKGT